MYNEKRKPKWADDTWGVKPQSIFKFDKNQDDGLRSLRSDIGTGVSWVKLNYLKKKLGAEGRPMGAPKTKTINNRTYKFFALVDTKNKADELAMFLREYGKSTVVETCNLCKGKWVVWSG